MHYRLFLALIAAIPIFSKAQLPYTQPQFAYDSIMNLTYGVDTDYAGNIDTLKLDLYKPTGDINCHRPIIVLVHGGAWIGGDKSDPDLVYLSRQFARRGWVVANINYRLGTHKAANYDMYAFCNTTLSQPCGYISDSAEVYRGNFRGMQDARGAIRFMKSRHATDSTDVDAVFIAGESAGAFISLWVAYMDQSVEKPASCFALSDAPKPDADFSTYGCVPSTISYARGDLGGIEGDLNVGSYDSRVKGVGDWFGAIFDASLFNQVADTPDLYIFHQGSDVVVSYKTEKVLGRVSWECYSQSNICQPYYFYPIAMGGKSMTEYLNQQSGLIPHVKSEILENYNYLNDCFAGGHAPDNIKTRTDNMADFFAQTLARRGNVPGSTCSATGILANASANNLFISPNPSEGNAFLSFYNAPSTWSTAIIDLSGRLVRSLGQTLQLPADLSPGIYVVEVLSPLGKFTSRWVKIN